MCLPERRAEVRFASLKQEGNDFVKRGQFQDALGKYTECLTLRPEECAIYTNRSGLSKSANVRKPNTKSAYSSG